MVSSIVQMEGGSGKMTQRIAQKGVILNKTKDSLLLIKYESNKYQSQKLAGKLGLPGGQMEFGEQPDESFIREIKEETGMLIKPLEPFYIWTWIYQKGSEDK